MLGQVTSQSAASFMWSFIEKMLYEWGSFTKYLKSMNRTGKKHIDTSLHISIDTVVVYVEAVDFARLDSKD